jgi:hypothetical protein
MRQLFNATPFEKVLAHPSLPLVGRWQALVEGDSIAAPAARPGGPSGLCLAAARAIIELLEGRSDLRFVPQTDPAFTIKLATNEQSGGEAVVYRTRTEQIVTTSPVAQSRTAAVLFAARLMSQSPASADLVGAYKAALVAYAAGAPDAVILPLVATASDELLAAIRLDLNQGAMVWLYGAKIGSDDLEELEDLGALDLRPLVGDSAVFGAFVAGAPTSFEALRGRPKS